MYSNKYIISWQYGPESTAGLSASSAEEPRSVRVKSIRRYGRRHRPKLELELELDLYLMR